MINKKTKDKWFEEYSQLHKDNEIFLNSTTEESNQSDTFNGRLFPIAMKVSAKTIGLDLVPVQPMSSPGGTSKEEMDKIIAETKSINRDNKIDNILEGKEYKEVDIKDHPNYKGPSNLFYMDMVYGSTQSSK